MKLAQSPDTLSAFYWQPVACTPPEYSTPFPCHEFPPAGSSLPFDLNGHVSFRLTCEGIEHLYAFHESEGIATDGPAIDPDG